jgi:Excalibur calcium-binding domain
MLIAAILLSVTPLMPVAEVPNFRHPEAGVTKRKKKASSGVGRKFGSCAAARRAGFSHMRRGQAGYSGNLDRDGDGVACDKVK